MAVPAQNMISTSLPLVTSTVAATPTTVPAASAALLPTPAATALTAASPAAAATLPEATKQSIRQLLDLLKMALQSFSAQSALPSLSVPTTAVVATPAAAVVPTPAAVALPAPVATPAATDRLTIAQIDSFSGSTHGATMKQIIQNGGNDPSLAGKIDVLEFDLGGGGSAGIASNLQNIVNQVKAGKKIDAVNISQQSFGNGANEQQVRALIDELAGLGVPVAVAAGNSGPNQLNRLTSNNSFNVESTGGDSGTGNVQGNATTTSASAAGIVTLLAAKKNQGQTLAQIRSSLPT